MFGAGSDAWRFLGNSLVVAIVSTAISVVFGCLAAYSLARLTLPFRLSRLIGLAFLVVRFYPKISIALPCFVLMRRLGLLDTRAAVTVAHVSLTLPFVVWLMLAFFEEFPRELEESAMIDGCGVVRRVSNERSKKVCWAKAPVSECLPGRIVPPHSISVMAGMSARTAAM